MRSNLRLAALAVIAYGVAVLLAGGVIAQQIKRQSDALPDASAEDVADAIRLSRKEREIARNAVELATENVERRLHDSTPASGDADIFNAALICLHLLREQSPEQGRWGQEAIVFQRLAERRWKTSADDSPAKVVARLISQLQTEADDEIQVHRLNSDDQALRQAFETNSNEPWPLDWAIDEKYWVQVAETFFQSLRDDNPADAWHKLAASKRMHMANCAAAYVGVLHAVAHQPDVRLIETFANLPSVRTNESEVDAIRRWAIALSAIAKCGLAKDESVGALRSQLSARLFAKAETGPASYLVEVTPELASVYIACGPKEASPLARHLLNRAGGDLFAGFCQQAKIDTVDMYEMFMTKHCHEPPYSGRPYRLLDRLAWQVQVPIWIDSTVIVDDAELEFDEEGPWLSTMSHAAEKAGYELVQLQPWIFWLGPAGRRAAAAAALREAKGVMPDLRRSDPQAADILRRTVSLSFEKTTLSEACQYLDDAYDLHTLCAGSGAEKQAVAMHVEAMPLDVALSLLAHEHGLDWEIANDTIVLGPAKWTADFRLLAEEQQLLRKARESRTDKIAKATRSPAAAAFYKTPLGDVAEYFSYYHDVAVIADSRSASLEITHDWRDDTELDRVLTMLCFRHRIAWHDDADAIYLCAPERLAYFRNLAPQLAARRKNFPRPLAEKLRTLVPLGVETNDLDSVARKLAAQTGVPVVVDAQEGGVDLTKQQVLGHCAPLPLDLLLTLIADELEIQWVIRDNQVHFCQTSP